MDNFRDFLIETDTNTEHEILNMYNNRHYKINDIKEMTGMSTAGIYRVLEKYGISPYRIHPKDNHYIVSQYAGTGTSVQKIAELTGYSRRQVYNIINKTLTD